MKYSLDISTMCYPGSGKRHTVADGSGESAIKMSRCTLTALRAMPAERRPRCAILKCWERQRRGKSQSGVQSLTARFRFTPLSLKQLHAVNSNWDDEFCGLCRSYERQRCWFNFLLGQNHSADPGQHGSSSGPEPAT